MVSSKGISRPGLTSVYQARTCQCLSQHVFKPPLSGSPILGKSGSVRRKKRAVVNLLVLLVSSATYLKLLLSYFHPGILKGFQEEGLHFFMFDLVSKNKEEVYLKITLLELCASIGGVVDIVTFHSVLTQHCGFPLWVVWDSCYIFVSTC